jgi:hypothetical protein
MTVESKLLSELDKAERKAWDSLSRYKFQMFGYWAAIWVHLNRVGGFKRPSPWRDLVAQAKLEKTALSTGRPDCELLDSPFSAITQIDEEKPHAREVFPEKESDSNAGESKDLPDCEV